MLISGDYIYILLYTLNHLLNKPLKLIKGENKTFLKLYDLAKREKKGGGGKGQGWHDMRNERMCDK